MDTLPNPPVPLDCDLRNYPYMPLDVGKLRDSTFRAISDYEAFSGAVLAWCAAWHQVPAGSLPDDDRVLANLLGYGRDVSAWQAIKKAALYGFVKCSDGRLYHMKVCEKALAAWDQRIKNKKRGQSGAKARWNKPPPDTPAPYAYDDQGYNESTREY